MDPATPAYDSFREEWLNAEPEWRVLRALCADARAPRDEALLLLEYHLRETAFQWSHRDVARTKLAWWREELLLTAQDRPRHPLTKQLALVADAPTRARLFDAADGAAALVAMESIARTEDLIAATARLIVPLMRARGADVGVDGGHGLARAVLMLEARRWTRFADAERALLPLDLLARAELTRVAAESDQAELALRTVLRALVEPFDDRATPAHNAASLARCDRARMALAVRLARQGAVNPRDILRGTGLRPRMAWAWTAWRAARGS